MRRPFIYQEYDGIRHEVAGGYRVLSNTKRLNDSGPRVAFRTGTYDASRPLVIDPVLAYSTYLGGSGQEFGQDIAVDSGGNAYVTGFTSSIDFPTVSALQSTFAGVNDAFVTKVNPAGSAAVYSTYLGGSDDDEAFSIAVDASGNAYVTGFTQSVDFPTASPLQSALGGVRDAFVAKLDPTGSALVYSTYLGGSAPDVGESIALDASNNAYVTGFTDSSNFPTQNPIQGALNGTADAFVTKVNSAGSALVYSTYLGGSGEEGGFGIAVDTTGSAYVSGRTRSIDFPTVNPIQPSFAGGIDTFVTKVNSAGSALVYSTYLGGSSNDFGSGIALDPSGNAYVTGTTGSSNFPTVNPLQSTLSGAFDAFVTKVNAAGSAFVYSTYLGGSGSDGAALHGIAVDQRGNAYLTGQTDSANFPTANALQTSLGGASDGYAAKLNAAGSTLFYSTYLGGSGFDSGFSVAVDRCKGDAYLTGRTESTDFPTANPFQGALAGPRDAFVAKLAFPPQEQIQILRNQVAALVVAGVLNPGQGNALDTQLRAALNALTSGDVNTAISRLQSFINQVNAFIDGNVLTRAQGQPLIDGANEVIAVLSC